MRRVGARRGYRTSGGAPLYLHTMTQASLSQGISQALAKGLRDNRDAVRDLLAEVLEDVALARAIERGRKTKPVKRASVMKALARRR